MITQWTNEDKREECCNGKENAKESRTWWSLWHVAYEFPIFNLPLSLQSNAIVENFLEQNLFGAHVSEREFKRENYLISQTTHQLQPFFGEKKSKPVYSMYW